jgi:predicted ribosomally synthesized peptide with SipW-like signal peptide
MGRHSPARMPRTGTLSRRLRAILAGGLVLGVGAAVTLAAWTDQENGSGTFTASTFNTQSSIDRATWEHNTNPPVAILTAGTGMSPTVSVFSAFNIRTTTATTVGGNVLLNGTTSTGVLSGALEYRIARAATFTTTCDAAAMAAGTFVTDATDAGTWTNAGTAAPGAINSAIATAGGELRYCIEVRIKAGSANSFQGTSGTLTWTFTSTSTS